MKKLYFNLLLVASVFGFFASAASASSVTVQKGDSLWKIAQRYNVSFSEVLRLNNQFSDPAMIHPNDVVYLPDGSSGTSTGQSSSSDNIAQGNSSAIAGSTDAKIYEVVKLVNAERENIAAGQRSASEVMQSWLNSSGHRANILSPKYTEIGVGYYAGGSYGRYWTQLFIGK